MSEAVESTHNRLIFRLRAARAAGAFFSSTPPAVDELITLFEARRYREAKAKAGELISEGLWVAMGTIAAHGCDEIMSMVPTETSPAKITVEQVKG